MNGELIKPILEAEISDKNGGNSGVLKQKENERNSNPNNGSEISGDYS